MKKTILTALVFAIYSASVTADESPSIYGRLDLSVTHSDLGSTVYSGTSGVNVGESGTYLENNSSNIGLKGKSNINDDIKIIYKMEFGVNNMSNRANDSSKVFSARNSYLGIETVYGSLLIGRNDTVFKTSEGKVDIFGTTNADINQLVAGQTRSADGLWYYSPKLFGLVDFNATYLMQDNYGVDDNLYALSMTSGDKELKNSHYYLAAALNKGIANIDAYRAVTQIKLGDVKLGGIFQHTENLTFSNMKGHSYFINATYDLSGITLKAEFGKDRSGLGGYFSKLVGQNDEVTDVDISQFTIGIDKKVTKSTRVYTHFSVYEGEYRLSGIKQDVGDDKVVTLGVRHVF
ncbi:MULTISPECIES: porin [Shewanella]|uniref:Porin n=1 Tax=Shewanella vaxholmensis TaxID=3063535 RepID=A0ABU9ULQ3_9GAMM|nr:MULTISPECIES: porin [unclassified Shewanella]MDT3293701.1 porin [Shewanella sp. SP2S2-6]MDT3305720.1 porin [Shewanella sp. SP1S1-4]